MELDAMRPLTSLVLTFSAFAVLAGAAPTARAQYGSFNTCTGWHDPGSSSTVTLDTGFGYGERFTVPFSGQLVYIGIESYQHPNDPATFGWWLNRVGDDGAIGEVLASGSFVHYGNAPPEFPISPAVSVEGGESLFFGIQKTSSLPGTVAAFEWYYCGASSAIASVAGAQYQRGGSASSVWTESTSTNHFRLMANVMLCSGDFTTAGPTISVPLAIEVAVGSDHGTLTGAAEDPDRLASISFDGVTDPVVAWPSSGAPTTAVVDAEVAVTWMPEAQSITGQVFDHCGNFTAVEIPISYYVCVPESPVCADGAFGTVFYVPLEPSDDGCYIRCTTDALGDNLACQSYCGM